MCSSRKRLSVRKMEERSTVCISASSDMSDTAQSFCCRARNTRIRTGVGRMPRALSISFGFLFARVHGFSPLFSSQSPLFTTNPLYNLYAGSLLGPQEQRTEDRITAAASFDKGLPQKGGVGSTVIAMVNMPPKPQQRKKKPKSLHCAPCQNPHRLCKNVLPAPRIVNSYT